MKVAKWEKSRARYNRLIAGLDELINETEQTLSNYEKFNLDFAYDLYNEKMNKIMEETGCMHDYEDSFKTTHESLESKLEHLRKCKDDISLKMLLDKINQPPN